MKLKTINILYIIFITIFLALRKKKAIKLLMYLWHSAKQIKNYHKHDNDDDNNYLNKNNIPNGHTVSASEIINQTKTIQQININDMQKQMTTKEQQVRSDNCDYYDNDGCVVCI